MNMRSFYSNKIRYILFFFFALIAANISLNGENDSSYSTTNIYVVKSYWHTGIILPVNEITIAHIPVINNFNQKKYVDIGFGDRVFYLDPEYDIALAARAILVPTESTVRFAAAIGTIEDIVRRSDYALKIKLKNNELDSLCIYINNTLQKDTSGNTKLIESKANGEIQYFEGEQKYHLFNTCNTWVARALNFAGLDFIEPANIISSKDLFAELIVIAEVLKEDTTDSFF